VKKARGQAKNLRSDPLNRVFSCLCDQRYAQTERKDRALGVSQERSLRSAVRRDR
jgi:hypothetical protein